MAIPLHRSARFVDIISSNIDSISGYDVEILVSDRTLADDALEILRTRHHADPRVRFVGRQAEPGWITHYNELLTAARGEYVMWMPHDDDFPPDYVPLLADALDHRPEALLAFGEILPINLEGEAVDVELPPPPIALGESSHTDEAILLLDRWGMLLGIPFRGLFRRDAILDRGLSIRQTQSGGYADALWMFAVAACGTLVFVPSCTCHKRYYTASTHATWTWASTDEFRALRVIARYLVAAKLPARDCARLLRFAGIRALRNAVFEFPPALRDRAPGRIRRELLRVLEIALQCARPPTLPSV